MVLGVYGYTYDNWWFLFSFADVLITGGIAAIAGKIIQMLYTVRGDIMVGCIISFFLV